MLANQEFASKTRKGQTPGIIEAIAFNWRRPFRIAAAIAIGAFIITFTIASARNARWTAADQDIKGISEPTARNANTNIISHAQPIHHSADGAR
jgi:hypothetical protein